MKWLNLAAIATEPVSHNPAIQKRVLLRRGELPYLTNFAQARFAPGQVAPGHAHTDMAEVFLVESGQGTLVINQVPHPLHPGVCVVVEPSEHHEVRNDGPEDLVLTYFGLQVLSSPTDLPQNDS